ncbi:ureidoglycolate lyase [Alphaproteobacteria bacterium]|nr:ureidoglycolate lyase [Alphaproteobacteria bacterium]
MKSIPIVVITKDNFLPFGHLIDKKNAATKYLINQETTERHHNISELSLNNEGGTPTISIFSGTPRAMPIEIKIMEKHPIASQSFLPMQNIDWLTVVCHENNGIPDLNNLKCFLINGNMGITYNQNVWHHPLLVKNKQDFWIIDRTKTNEPSSINLVEYHFLKKEIQYLSF